MPKIIVADKSVGSCTIEYNKNASEDPRLSLKKEMAIKSLAALQLVCITRTHETESDFDKMIEVLQETINQIDSIFNNHEHTHSEDYFGDYYN
jgi:hypothetical protein